jgi:hypothetical protein
MKLSWVFVIILLLLVAIFSVQNAEMMTVRFMFWHFDLSAALVIQLAALFGASVGLVVGVYSSRTVRPGEPPAKVAATPVMERDIPAVIESPGSPPRSPGQFRD